MDGTTIYTCGPNVENVVAKLESDALAISEWFPNNHMKLNENKCHLMIFSGKSNEVSVQIGEAKVKESKEKKLLGIIFDQALSFTQHVKTLCKKASQKLHALARISWYMATEKLKQVMQAFFSYSPLVWIFYDRTLKDNPGINTINAKSACSKVIKGIVKKESENITTLSSNNAISVDFSACSFRTFASGILCEVKDDHSILEHYVLYVNNRLQFL